MYYFVIGFESIFYLILGGISINNLTPHQVKTSNMKQSKKSIVILGATGAVGTEVVNRLLEDEQFEQLTLLGRRPVPGITSTKVKQYEVNIFDKSSYDGLLEGHDVAICTLGVGEPSKVSDEHFIKVDKTAVIDFAAACKSAGVQHFQLLASVGIDANSRSFYLRTKGELVEYLKDLQFDRLSIFKPSMIITPQNRYGLSQAIVLKVWPVISPFFMGGLTKYRGIEVAELGTAIANNTFTTGDQLEYLQWDQFKQLLR